MGGSRGFGRYIDDDGFPRIPGTVPDDYLYAVDDGVVTKHSLDYRGRIAGEGEVVFSDEVNCRPMEVITFVDQYCGTVKISTSSSSEGRVFIITEEGPVVDSDGRI